MILVGAALLLARCSAPFQVAIFSPPRLRLRMSAVRLAAFFSRDCTVHLRMSAGPRSASKKTCGLAAVRSAARPLRPRRALGSRPRGPAPIPVRCFCSSHSFVYPRHSDQIMRGGPRDIPENAPLGPSWHLRRLGLVDQRYHRALAWAADKWRRHWRSLLWEVLDAWWEALADRRRDRAMAQLLAEEP